jgi:hypothetical protein
MKAKEQKNCAFQYAATEWYATEIIEDACMITLTEAKKLFNKHYPDMVKRASRGDRISVSIWVDMAHDANYHKTLIHLDYPKVENGELIKRVTNFYPPFKLGK